MRHYRGLVWGFALVVLAAGTSPARAAWDNVFQTTCWGCNKPATAYYYAPPVVAAAPAPCPQPCTTRYVQRSYYQPVTSYKTETYYEPVTTYRTSYYYEPVTSVRYSCYYDPCTGCPQQVAQQVTSYQLRSQSCPVTSYMARTACKPVTSYQIAYYYEPQTTCCQTTIGAPVMAPPSGAPPTVGDTGAPPTVGDTGGSPPTVRDSSMKYSEPPRIMPKPVEPNSYRQPSLGAPVVPPPEPAKVRLDKIVALPRADVEGKVIASGQPQSKARVLFVNADLARTQEEVTTDDAGHFRATLASGNWLVYTHNADGRPVFHRKLEVREDAPTQLTLGGK